MTVDAKKVLVLGATGMLGSAMLRYFAARGAHDVVGSVRSRAGVKMLSADLRARIVAGVDVENSDSVTQLFAQMKPNVVINCIGLVKQLEQVNDPLVAIPINALLPHRLARLSALAGARLVHISTDCVFSGAKGGYVEQDVSDAKDLYGRSKFLGEVDYPNAITLRTSIIGHELDSAHGLVGWFLAQQGSVRGFSKAVFSGFPTVELAQIIHDIVIPRPELRGLYHVSSDAIDKESLLKKVARTYGKDIEIVPDDKLQIDRSLSSVRFRAETGYAPPDWDQLVEKMHRFA